MQSRSKQLNPTNTMPWSPEVVSELTPSFGPAPHSGEAYFRPHEKFTSISSIAPALHSHKLDHSEHTNYQRYQPKGVSPRSPEVLSELISSVATPLRTQKLDYQTNNQSSSSFGPALHSGEAYFGPHEKFSSISLIAPALHSHKLDHSDYQRQQPKGISPQDLIYDHHTPAYFQRSQVQQPVYQANAYYQVQPPERSKNFYQQGIEDIIHPKLQYSHHRGRQNNEFSYAHIDYGN